METTCVVKQQRTEKWAAAAEAPSIVLTTNAEGTSSSASSQMDHQDDESIASCFNRSLDGHGGAHSISTPITDSMSTKSGASRKRSFTKTQHRLRRGELSDGSSTDSIEGCDGRLWRAAHHKRRAGARGRAGGACVKGVKEPSKARGDAASSVGEEGYVPLSAIVKSLHSCRGKGSDALRWCGGGARVKAVLEEAKAKIPARTTLVLDATREQELLEGKALRNRPLVPLTPDNEHLSICSDSFSICSSDSSLSSSPCNTPRDLSSAVGVRGDTGGRREVIESGEEADIEQASEDEEERRMPCLLEHITGLLPLPRDPDDAEAGEVKKPSALVGPDRPVGSSSQCRSELLNGEASNEPDQPVDPENAYCDVCGGGESYETDNILLCDGCDVAVHQTCYGVPEVPTGDWLCAKCVSGCKASKGAGSGSKSITCHFCGQKDGAFKSSREGDKWAHVLCVWYDPDAVLEDPDLMEPLVIRRPPSDERRAECVICGHTVGFTIQCGWPGCPRRFHARCAQSGGFLRMEAALGGLLTEAYCDVHKHERVGCEELVSRLKGMVRGTSLEPPVLAIERRVAGEDPYVSYAAFAKDLSPVLEALSVANKESVNHVQYRLQALRKRLETTQVMLSGRR